jgi:hypothetical protein
VNKLKLKLWQIENIVLIKVIEQDESLRDVGTFYENNDMSIISEVEPQLEYKELYIRGNDKANDNIIVKIDFDTTDETKDYINKVLKVVKEYNQSLDGIKPDNTSNDVSVYIAE